MTSVLEANGHRSTLAIMNISYAADLWLGELERQGHSDRTVDTYRRLLDKLAGDHAKHIDIRDLSVTHIRKFLDRQARNRKGNRKSPATVAQNVSIINGFFDWLTREGVIPRNPTRRNGDQVISRPRQVRPEDNDNVTTVSSEAVRKLLATANTSGWPERIAVNCLVYLGPRRAALTKLRVRDYDPVGRRLTFQEKGGNTIEKPVPNELARIIEAAIIAGVYETDDDYLVPSRASQRRGGDRDDRIIWRLVKDTADKAGVTTHVHALRAAFAVHFLETHGGELVALQKLMGHKRIETTLVYLRRLDRQQQMETVRDLSWGAADIEEEKTCPTAVTTQPHPECGATPAHASAANGKRGGTRDTTPQSECLASDTPTANTTRTSRIASGGQEKLTPTPPAKTVDPALLEKVRAVEVSALGGAPTPADVSFPSDSPSAVTPGERGPSTIQQIAGEPLESNALTEKEGFEPSLAAKSHGERAGSENGADVPEGSLDLALLEKVRAIQIRASMETVDG